MTLRLCFLSLIAVSAYLLLHRTRSAELLTDHWQFFQSDGRWKWRNVRKGRVHTSNRRFETDIEAVADALENGFRLSFSTMAPIVENATPASDMASPRQQPRAAGSARRDHSQGRRAVAHRRFGASQRDRAGRSERRAAESKLWRSIRRR